MLKSLYFLIIDIQCLSLLRIFIKVIMIPINSIEMSYHK